MSNPRRLTQRKLSLSTTEEELLRQEVQDALEATVEERLQAAESLLSSIFELWAKELPGHD